MSVPDAGVRVARDQGGADTLPPVPNSGSELEFETEVSVSRHPWAAGCIMWAVRCAPSRGEGRVEALQIVVALGVALLVGSVVARRTGIASPITLVVAGLALALVPQLRGIELPAEAVLVLFLPILLFWEALTSSGRLLRRFFRGILLSGILLVVVTAAAIAWVAHLLGLPWETAWIIGAALAPTDATAVAALGRDLPSRTAGVLKSESLINDGTALVLYALALSLTTHEEAITPGHVTVLFSVSFFGGLAVGLAGGWLLFQIRRRLTDPLLNAVFIVLTPFILYLVAEEMGASGVLAVVACGLLWVRMSPLVVNAQSRQHATPFFTLTTFLLNGALFVLIGLELPIAVGGLSAASIGTGMLVTVAVYVAMTAVRFAFLVTSAYLIRFLDRRPHQRTLRTTNRARVVSTVAGFRGAVSLAVALSVPLAADGVGVWPHRDMIVFVVAGVVVTSIVLQGLALPAVVRWARLPQDTSAEDELALARRVASREAFDALPSLARELGIASEVIDDVTAEIRTHLEQIDPEDEEFRTRVADAHSQYRALRVAVIGHKRATVVRLRNEGTIDDAVLRQVQASLDLEEVRLTGSGAVE